MAKEKNKDKETNKEKEVNEQELTENQELTELDKLKIENADLSAKLKEMTDKYMYTLADFDNYKKNSIKERSNLVKYRSEILGKDMTLIKDDFERAISAIDSSDIDTLKEGLVLIYSKLVKTLENNGIREITVNKGDEFDTKFHEAMSVIPVVGMEGKIIDVQEKGYILNDKVIRYAKVIVGQKN